MKELKLCYKEQIRRVPDFPDYLITTMGRIFRVTDPSSRFAKRNPEGFISFTFEGEGVLLYPMTMDRCVTKSRTSNTVPVVYLSRNKIKSKTCYLHRLMAQAFIPNPHGYKFCIALDGNYFNLSVLNFTWSSRKKLQYVTAEIERDRKMDVDTLQHIRETSATGEHWFLVPGFSRYLISDKDRVRRYKGNIIDIEYDTFLFPNQNNGRDPVYNLIDDENQRVDVSLSKLKAVATPFDKL